MRIFLLLALLACTGCASYPVPPITYTVDRGFRIVVASPADIQEMWETAAPEDRRSVGGFFDYSARTVYVEYNIHDKTQPNFEFLGHEVWHLPELGGMFHR
jgi:hypothetical protein